MAGVGPFAVPAAKKGCYVLGNDLNPESVKWMRENRVKNRVSGVGVRNERSDTSPSPFSYVGTSCCCEVSSPLSSSETVMVRYLSAPV
jgi:ribosomal protein L11 methylase PrmA